MSLIKTVLIRILSFTSAFLIGLLLFLIATTFNEEPKSYLVRATIYKRPVSTDCKGLRPNPLILLVSIDKNRQLQLNFEDIGTLENTTQLETTLTETFGERTAMDVYEENTKLIEKTVLVSPDESLKYDDVIKLIEVLNHLGANSVIVDPNKENCLSMGSS